MAPGSSVSTRRFESLPSAGLNPALLTNSFFVYFMNRGKEVYLRLQKLKIEKGDAINCGLNCITHHHLRSVGVGLESFA